MICPLSRLWLSRVYALFYLATPWAIALSHPAYAQTSSVDCVQAQGDWNESRVRSLLAQAETTIAIGQTELTLQWLTQSLQSIQRVPNVQTRTYLLGEILNVPNPQNSVLQRLLNQRQGTPPAPDLLTFLGAMEDAVRQIPTGYSFFKTQTLTTIASIYVELSETERAMIALAQAEQASHTIQGAEFQVNALTPIAAVYGQLDDTRRAMAVLSQSESFATQLNHPDAARQARLWASIARGYAQVDELETALAFMPRLEASPYDQGMVLTDLMRIELQGGDLRAAEAIAQEISVPALQALAEMELAQAYDAEGQRDVAIAHFDQALTLAQSVEDYLLSQILQTYAQVDPEQAATHLDRLTHPATRMSFLGHLAIAQAVAGNLEQAEYWIEELRQQIASQPDAVSQIFPWLLDEAIANGTYDVAIQLVSLPTDSFFDRTLALLQISNHARNEQRWDVAEEALNQIPSDRLWERYQAFQTLATDYVMTGQVERAYQLVDSMDPAYFSNRIQVWMAMATALESIGDSSQAEEVVQRAETLTMRMTDPYAQIESWGAIALGYDQMGRINETQATLERILMAVQALADPSSGEVLLRNMAGAFLQKNALEPALYLMQQTLMEPPDAGMIQDIFDRAIALGRYDMAQRAMEQLSMPESQIMLGLRLVDRYELNHQTHEAGLVLQHLHQIAATLADPEVRTVVVRVDYDAEGNVISALEVDDDYDRASVYDAIALRYARLGRFADARATAELIQDPGLRDPLIQRLHCSL